DVSNRQFPWCLGVPCGAGLSHCSSQRRGEASHAPSSAELEVAHVNKGNTCTGLWEFCTRKQLALCQDCQECGYNPNRHQDKRDGQAFINFASWVTPTGSYNPFAAFSTIGLNEQSGLDYKVAR